MIALIAAYDFIEYALLRPRPAYWIMVKRLLAPALGGYWLGEALTWMGEAYLLGFALFALVLAGVLIFLMLRVILRERR